MRHEVDIARVQPFGIELPVGEDGEIDLHNFADFLGYDSSTAGMFKLKWKASEARELNIRWAQPKGKFKLETITGIEWVFEQVTDFRVDARDPEMPTSEDKTLEYFGLSDEGAVLRGSFVFHGGVKIEVIAKRTYIETQ